jgi:mono/diheme cytochrome c family protein
VAVKTPVAASIACAMALGFASASAQDEQTFPPEQVRTGADIYERNCSPCHGPRMLDPHSAVKLRIFPLDQR